MNEYVGKGICFICNGEVLLRNDRDFTGGVAVCPKDARKVGKSLGAIRRMKVCQYLEASVGSVAREETR